MTAYLQQCNFMADMMIVHFSAAIMSVQYMLDPAQLFLTNTIFHNPNNIYFLYSHVYILVFYTFRLCFIILFIYIVQSGDSKCTRS